MKPDGHDVHKQHTFDAYCKRVLKNEARDILDEYARLREKEDTFSDLTPQELERISILDDYPSDYEWFQAGEYSVKVQDEQLAEALRTLANRKRDIVLLAYFLEMRDGEIAEYLRMVRSTVQYQRTSSLRELKEYLEGEHNGKT